MLSPFEEKVLKEFKEKVQKAFGNKILYLKLFGSRARGLGNEFSDLDVVVVVTEWDGPMKRKIFDLAWECYWNEDANISPLVLSQQEYEELKSLERNIAKDIESHGIPL